MRTLHPSDIWRTTFAISSSRRALARIIPATDRPIRSGMRSVPRSSCENASDASVKPSTTPRVRTVDTSSSPFASSSPVPVLVDIGIFLPPMGDPSIEGASDPRRLPAAPRSVTALLGLCDRHHFRLQVHAGDEEAGDDHRRAGREVAGHQLTAYPLEHLVHLFVVAGEVRRHLDHVGQRGARHPQRRLQIGERLAHLDLDVRRDLQRLRVDAEGTGGVHGRSRPHDEREAQRAVEGIDPLDCLSTHGRGAYRQTAASTAESNSRWRVAGRKAAAMPLATRASTPSTSSPAISATARYSSVSVVANMWGSSVLTVTTTPASISFPTGCSASDGTTRVHTFEVGHTSSGMAASAR